MQVHAWVNVLLTAHFGQPLPHGHVLEKHPEWAMAPKSVATAAFVAPGPRRLKLILDAGRAEGDVEGYYLSPAVPQVGAHLEAVVRELVRGYAVDGLHLDFIRYPGPSFDYSRAALEGFREGDGRRRRARRPGPQSRCVGRLPPRGAHRADDAPRRRGARRAAGHRGLGGGGARTRRRP